MFSILTVYKLLFTYMRNLTILTISLNTYLHCNRGSDVVHQAKGEASGDGGSVVGNLH